MKDIQIPTDTLSTNRMKEIDKAGVLVDMKLLANCAYYPKRPVRGRPSSCTFCSFDAPNHKCKRSRLLYLSRMDTSYDGKVKVPIKRKEVDQWTGALLKKKYER